MEILPAVDVLGGAVVRLHRGNYEKATIYGHEPVAAARQWVERGAQLVHLVDLEGARRGRPNLDLCRRLSDAGIDFQVGGGLRTVADVENALRAGASRVVVGTAAVNRPSRVTAMLQAAGEARLVAAIDVADGAALDAGWVGRGRSLETVVGSLVAVGVRRALVTSIARDGTMTGPDLDLLDRVAELAPEMSLLAAGGVGRLDDLRSLAGWGVEAAVVGAALYEGRFTLGEALAAAGVEPG